MANVSRRRFVLTSGATAIAALLAKGCTNDPNTGTTAVNPSVSSGDAPETGSVRLGFISLTDCAPLVIAKVKGYFDKQGMTNVTLVKEPSWSAVRDDLELGGEGGGTDGAHILSPMPYLMAEGRITARKIPMYILARLNLNGQGISIANDYKESKVGIDSNPFLSKIKAAKDTGKPFRYAVTFQGGTHDLWMRYWLAAGGIDPDLDATNIVIPPPQMVVSMQDKSMDAFCVGEPWNAKLIGEKLGYSVLTTGQLWKNHPEKAFSMRADWVDANPKATKALLMAIMEAQIWCDKPENKQEMAEIIAAKEWVNTDLDTILARAQGKFDFGDGRVEENSPNVMKFWADNASYPYKSHDLWFVTENMRWGYLPADTDAKKLVDAVNREDLWKEAAKAIAQEAAIPQSTSRGVESFFNGIQFDPENPTAYLTSQKIKFVGERSLSETLGN